MIGYGEGTPEIRFADSDQSIIEIMTAGACRNIANVFLSLGHFGTALRLDNAAMLPHRLSRDESGLVLDSLKGYATDTGRDFARSSHDQRPLPSEQAQAYLAPLTEQPGPVFTLVSGQAYDVSSTKPKSLAA
jgi:hypothetical protein